MLATIDVRNNRGDLLNIDMLDEDASIVVDKDNGIEGLDPVKATMVTSSFAQMSGEQYQSSKREARNIKFKFNLMPDFEAGETVSDIRDRLYNIFMSNTPVDMTFTTTEGLSVDISGRVETCERDPFSKEPQINVSIVCFKPDFYVPGVNTINGYTTFNNDEIEIDYPGTIETGLVFTLNADRYVSEFTIYHTPPDGSMRSLDYTLAMDAGDVLRISTIRGDKSATVTKSGVVRSVLYGINPYSNWIEIQPGLNKIRVYTEGVGVPFTMDYITKYGGL